MNILGLIEMHPFDGTDPFICLRIKGPTGLFDLPITTEQLAVVMRNTEATIPDTAEDRVEEQPEPVTYQNSNTAEDPIVINSNMYSMGSSTWDEDDDL